MGGSQGAPVREEQKDLMGARPWGDMHGRSYLEGVWRLTGRQSDLLEL